MFAHKNISSTKEDIFHWLYLKYLKQLTNIR